MHVKKLERTLTSQPAGFTAGMNGWAAAPHFGLTVSARSSCVTEGQKHAAMLIQQT